jgi:hypothetical protein
MSRGLNKGFGICKGFVLKENVKMKGERVIVTAHRQQQSTIT